MKVKKFVGKDYQEAIQKVKAELGSEAIIFQSREIKPKGLRRFFSPAQFEVTVIIDDELKIDLDRRHSTEAAIDAKNAAAARSSAAESVPEPDLKIETPPEPEEKLPVPEKESAAVPSRSAVILEKPMQILYDTLIKNNVDPQVAQSITEQMTKQLPQHQSDDEEVVEAFCLNYLRDYLNVIQPIRINPNKKGNLIFLVGPTGVGKTTTIAKLAANMTFVNQKKVALLTLDTYRVAAVEQLRTFAEIMDIAIGVVFSPKELREAVRKMMNHDVIFVDTAGRSPYNKEHMEEIHQCITMVRPDEVILVLSATTSSTDIVNLCKEFNNIGIDKIIFTKLDETKAWGQILNAVYKVHKPIAYITNGQNVPDDIAVPDPGQIAARLLLRELPHERPS